MSNSTNSSDYIWAYEYYYGYIDSPVDEKTLKANKYSIVIAFWSGLAVFVMLLFLMLLYMSPSNSPSEQNASSRRRCQRCCLDISSCLKEHENHSSSGLRPPLLDSREDEPGSGNQKRNQQNNSSDLPTTDNCHPCVDEITIPGSITA